MTSYVIIYHLLRLIVLWSHDAIPKREHHWWFLTMRLEERICQSRGYARAKDISIRSWSWGFNGTINYPFWNLGPSTTGGDLVGMQLAGSKSRNNQPQLVRHKQGWISYKCSHCMAGHSSIFVGRKNKPRPNTALPWNGVVTSSSLLVLSPC